MILRPYRSVLYIPASRERALDKAKTLAADAIIFDLEDAVAPSEKSMARDLLADKLASGGYGPRAQIVRINALDTDWGHDDLAAVAKAKPEAILLPKVNSAQDINTLDGLMASHAGFENTTIWAMMETPLGVLNAYEIATAPRMAGFVMGTNDLAKDLNTRFDPPRLPLITALSQSVLAAKAAGIAIVDGVYNAFKDEDGLKAEASQGRDLGMDGKTIIHPAQIAATNAVFAPTKDEVDLAHRQIEAFDAAIAAGEGVAVVDGKIVENLHVETAKGTIAKANAIQTLENGQ